MTRPLRRVRHTLAAGTAVLLLLGGVTACGSDADKASDEPEIAANDDSGDETEEETQEEVDADLPGEGEEVEPSDFTDWVAAGLENSTTAHMTMSTDFGMGSMETEGQVDYSQSPVEMAMTMSMDMLGGDPMDIRMVDGVMYMNMGAMSNNKFFEFDLSDPDSLPPGMEGLGDQMDPLATFRDAEDALDKVVYVGTEDVDGEELAHFTVTMDTTQIKSMGEVPPDAGMPKTIDYDLWLDDDYRMRQMHMVMDAMMTIEINAEIFDWGEPVTIEAPSADQISDAPMNMAG